jgi:hypothetical protein
MATHEQAKDLLACKVETARAEQVKGGAKRPLQPCL